MKSVWLCAASRGRQIFWLLTTYLALQAGPARATVFVWTNSASGNWSNPANWSPNGVPGSSDNAIITNSGTYTVTLDVSPTVGSLNLGGGIGQQTFAMTGNNLTLNSISAINTDGVLVLNGGALYDQGGLNVSGQITWTSGQLGSANVELNIATNGVLVLAGATGTSYNLGQPLSSAGTVQLQSGNLQIDYAAWGSFVNLPGGVDRPVWRRPGFQQ